MNFNLWKSVFQYNGEFPGSLSFKPNELFLVLRKENEYWFLVSDIDGTIGCVPINYLEKTQTKFSEIKRFVDKAIKSLSQKTASVISKRDDLIRDLLEFREASQTSKQKTQAPLPQQPTTVPKGLAFILTDTIRQATHSSHESSKRTLKLLLNVLNENIPEIKMWTKSIDTQLTTPSEYNLQDVFHRSSDWKNLNKLFNYFHQRKNDSQERGWSLHENVNELRKALRKLLKILKMSNTDLVTSFLELSQHESFLAMIEWYQLEQRTILRRQLLQIFIVCCEINCQSIEVCMQSVLPLELIRDLMDTNTDCKNFTYATLLFNILISGSTTINTDIKEKLNQNFCRHLLMQLSQYHHTILRTSYSNNTQSFDNGSKHNSIDIIEEGDLDSGKFCDNKEDDEDDEDDDDEDDDSDCQNSHNFSLKTPLFMDDVIFSLLLTLNKLFTSVRTNPVLCNLLAEPEHTQLFIEKLIRAFNRNYDPSVVTMFIRDGKRNKNSPNTNNDDKLQINSVRKILCDLYSNRNLSEIIYRNDADVIVDIITRQLCDLPPNSNDLSEYLLLLDLIITNSNYEHQGKYKLYDLKQALIVINQVSRDEISDVDQELSNSIAKKLELM